MTSGEFGGLDAMVERQLHLLSQQHRLVARIRAATVTRSWPWGEARPLPHTLNERVVLVAVQRRCDRLNVVAREATCSEAMPRLHPGTGQEPKQRSFS